MTPDELQQSEARFRQAFRRSETAREERNAAVRAAIAAGRSYGQVAKATGLTRARIGQIAKG